MSSHTSKTAGLVVVLAFHVRERIDPFLAQEDQGHAISGFEKRLKVLCGGGW